MPEFPKNTGFKMNKIKQGFTLKPQQTQWGPRSPEQLLSDARQGREAKRWLDSAYAAHDKRREFNAAEKWRKSQGHITAKDYGKMMTGTDESGAHINKPNRYTPPYYKKPGFLKKLFGRRGEGGLIGQEYNDETGEMENVISGELGRDATVGGNDAWGNVANIFTAGQMNRGSGKGGRLGSMFRSVKNLFTGGAKAAMRKPKMGKHYKK